MNAMLRTDAPTSRDPLAALRRVVLALLASLAMIAAPATAQDLQIFQGNTEVTDGGEYNFGDLRPGGFASRSFTVRNTGPSVLNLGATLTGTGFTASLNKTRLRPGQRARMVVTINRNVSGDFQSLVSIRSGGAEIFAFTARARVLAAAPEVRLTAGRTTLAPNDFFSFGQVREGASRTQVFTLRNTGTAPLSLSGVGVTGSGFVLIGNTPNTLAPGRTARFSVRLSSETPGGKMGRLTINSNAPATPSFGVDLGGTVGAALPSIQVSENAVLVQSGQAIDFGPVVVGLATPRIFRIRNNGASELVLGEVVSSDPQFSIQVQPDQMIAPGAFSDMFLIFQPASDMPQGTISIPTNDPQTPVFQFGVSGIGAPAPTIEVEYQNEMLANVPIDIGQTANFGILQPAGMIMRTVTIRNTGTATLNVGNVSVTKLFPPGDPNQFSVTQPPQKNLNPNQSSAFNVTLAGVGISANQPLAGRVTIPNNDPQRTNFFFIVTAVGADGGVPPVGAGARPVLRLFGPDDEPVNPRAPIDFGRTTIGSPVARAFTVTNHGSADLMLGGVTLAGSGFRLLTEPDIVIAPGGSTTFEIEMTASRAGQAVGAITLPSNDPERADPVVFLVTGQVER